MLDSVKSRDGETIFIHNIESIKTKFCKRYENDGSTVIHYPSGYSYVRGVSGQEYEVSDLVLEEKGLINGK